MRVARVGDRRSLARVVIFALAFLFITTYIAFDVLDIDGDNLAGLLTGGMVIVEAAQAETDRFLEASLWSSYSSLFDCPSRSNTTPIQTPQINITGTGMVLWHYSTLFPRTSPGILSIPPPADPVHLS